MPVIDGFADDLGGPLHHAGEARQHTEVVAAERRPGDDLLGIALAVRQRPERPLELGIGQAGAGQRLYLIGGEEAGENDIAVAVIGGDLIFGQACHGR